MTSAHNVFAVQLWPVSCHYVEGDDAQRLVLAVDTQEIQEGNRALQGCLSDESHLLAALEQGARHVLVDCEQDFREDFLVASDVDGRVSLSSHVVYFLWPTSVGAPKFLQVKPTKWNILAKDTVDLLKTGGHDGDLVSFAAHRSISVQEGANMLKVFIFCAGLFQSHGSIAIQCWIMNLFRVWARCVCLLWCPDAMLLYRAGVLRVSSVWADWRPGLWVLRVDTRQQLEAIQIEDQADRDHKYQGSYDAVRHFNSMKCDLLYFRK